MKSFILICTILLSGIMGISQNIEKDLEVAENILSGMIKTHLKENGRFFPSSFEVSSNYTEDVGVFFDVRARNMFLTGAIAQAGDELSRVYYDFADGQSFTVKSGIDEDEDEDEDEDDEKEDTQTSIKNACIEFLAEYGHIIRGLSPSEKIIINISPERNGLFRLSRNSNVTTTIGYANEDDETFSLSVQVDKQSIDDLRAGRIDRDSFEDRVEVEEMTYEQYKSEDMELFLSIFTRLYEKDLSETYFLSMNPPLYYEKIKDRGVIFYMKVFSSNMSGAFHFIPTKGLNKLSQEERDEVVEEMYPDFVDELKENILEYGRVIKTMEAKDILFFKIKLTECEGCTMPEKITLSIPYSAIQDYSDGKLSLDAAKNKFSLKES